MDQTGGTLLDRIDVVLRNANKAFRGLYHGYGLGIRSILDETEGPLPTRPHRTHASWPHVHCVCHCNAVANLGPDDGVHLSEFGGFADELGQTYFARMFHEVVYPMTWADMNAKYPEPGLARRQMKFVINY